MERLRVCKKYDVKYGSNAVFKPEDMLRIFEAANYIIDEDFYTDIKEIPVEDWKTAMETISKEDEEFAETMRLYLEEADTHDGWIHFDYI